MVQYPNGTYSLRERASGEVMHSMIGPCDEARSLYAEQSRLAERMAAGKVVLWDVGLGVAANAIAALDIWKDLPASERDLEIWSFENQVVGLRTALDRPEEFAFLAPWRTEIQVLLEHRKLERPGLRWQLLEGDFRDTLTQATAPDIVFYDMYPPRACPALWTAELFGRIHAQGPNIELYSYCAATPVRIGLLLAGFYVGHGCATSAKGETTVAATAASGVGNPLGERWLGRLSRSIRPWPYDVDPTQLTDAYEKIRNRILLHPQFHTFAPSPISEASPELGGPA